MQPLEAGEPLTIGAYRLLGRLGAGGMGRVYLGRSAGGRTVAVKVVHPHFALDEQFRARFRREVDAARRIGAQWTAPVLDADPDAPIPWVATGYVAGPPLSTAIVEHGPLPEHAVRTLGAGLAEALAAVHGLGLVHRDVKPSNVLLALDGPRLIDFGIAHAVGATSSLTSTGVSVGSPGYMAPEQIRGMEDISGAVDVFSLGAVLAYAATGSAPFLGDSSAVLLYKVVHEEPELGELEGELREVVAGCLEKYPEDRPTPMELARRLAPGGAAGLVTGGWLPGPLVRQVSRAAVALLDLEPQDAPAQSGPVPFSAASWGSDAANAANAADTPESGRGAWGGPGPQGAGGAYDGRGSTGAGGVYGPPGEPSSPASSSSFPSPSPAPDAYEPTRPPFWTATAADGSAARGPARPDTPGAPGLPGQRSPDPRFSVTVGAESGPSRSDGHRGRRLSCTVALAVAGVLAAVTVGGAFLFDLMPGGGGRDTADHGVGATPSTRPSNPPASDTDPGQGGVEQVTEVPKAFVGTWSGPLTEKTTGQPHGTLTAVFTEGRKGTDVVRMTTEVTALGLTVRCNSVAALTSGTDEELVLHERSDPDRPGDRAFCTSTETDVHFTRNADGTLRFRSEERGAGLPYGTLTRSGG
ncbi:MULTISPECIES: serine/threonine-protein kinase [unclassified Streptomyces]|uniref:serine/threonine-protein kinase n=1 Tax=unclassified Streptomyces TaxID=2593676 RepID=UPI00093CEB0F|nr:serine/threonine-protein kinase [Streptomyces sp. CB01580]OKJ36380.1 serine/threonine protein kinase [Streptomyces sp. CB01580]